MGSVCQLLEGPELEELAPEIADKLGLGLRCGCCRSHRLKPQCPPLLLCCFLSPSFMCPGSNIPPGCSDNWSQVRFASSTATRTFMQARLAGAAAAAVGTTANGGADPWCPLLMIPTSPLAPPFYLVCLRAVRGGIQGASLPAAAAPHVPQQVRRSLWDYRGC